MQTSLSELLVAEHNVILKAAKLIESNNRLWETDLSAYRAFDRLVHGSGINRTS